MQSNTEQNNIGSKVALDQDTVIGDAMCEASQLFYEAANQIARCINENAQCCIDNVLLRKAELALAYMQGVSFGLAMDDKVMKWYLTEMEKSMASILNSQMLAYQAQIYVPPPPGPLMGFDEIRTSGKYTFLDCLFNNRPPNENYINSVKKEIVKDDGLKYLFKKGLLDPHDFDGIYDKYPELAKVEEAPIPTEDKAIEKDGGKNITIADKEDSNEKCAEDDSSSATRLRNLLRQGRIDSSQYLGALASLVATGIISKGEFSRLKMSC